MLGALADCLTWDSCGHIAFWAFVDNFFLPLNPKKAGSFDPISQPGGGGGGVDSTRPRISAAERRKIM